MKHLDGTYDLTVDDIHDIRVEMSKIFETMTNEEIIDYLNKETNKFDERKNRNLQLV